MLPAFFVSCGSHPDKTIEEHDNLQARIPPVPFSAFTSADTARLGKTYMPTGFYSLTEDEGVKMLKEHSAEVYNLNLYPFVSVNHILRVELEKGSSEQSSYPSLNVVLDNEGTHALAEGTGNPVYPYMAVVVANRLLYVVKNVSKVTTGVMNISLAGYSDAEMSEMVREIKLRK